MKKWFKGSIAALFAMVMMLSSIIPAFAAEQQTADISAWAVNELNEGEKYGIFPTSWYYDSFTGEVTDARLEELLTLTEAKIAKLNLEKNEKYTPVDFTKSQSRGNILNGLFNIIAQYELPVGDSAIDYMLDRGIIVGTGTGLELERNATTEEAVLLATRLVQDTFKQAGAGAKGVAWKVENDGNLVYLLGSIHLGTTDFYPLNQDLLSAFDEADALLVEANLLDFEGLLYYTEASMFQDGRTLKDVVSEDTYEKVLQVLEKYEMPADNFLAYKPWALASVLSNLTLGEANNSSTEQMASTGVDMYFTLRALLAGKPTLELEGIKAQTDMFNGLSPETQESYLNAALDSILDPHAQEKSDAEIIQEWFGYWGIGDIEGFAKSFTSSESEQSEFELMLFGERDINMAEKIVQLLESDEKGTYFLVVGAGHFLNDQNIRVQLERQGYTVEEFYN